MIILLSAIPAVAQRSVFTSAGMVIRYHGDTIWLERDTTVNRTIFRGDTIVKSMSVNDRVRSSMTYVAFGDSARLIEVRDSTGNSAPQTKFPIMPLRALTIERMMLESELRMEESRARLGGYGIGAELEPPLVSDKQRTYVVSSAITIVQSRDTIRYLRGCAKLGRVDTTTFLLFNRDSLKRLSPPERMFGQAMAHSIIGQMRMATSRAWLDGRQAPPPADLPRAPEPCAAK